MELTLFEDLKVIPRNADSLDGAPVSDIRRASLGSEHLLTAVFSHFIKSLACMSLCSYQRWHRLLVNKCYITQKSRSQLIHFVNNVTSRNSIPTKFREHNAHLTEKVEPNWLASNGYFYYYASSNGWGTARNIGKPKNG